MDLAGFPAAEGGSMSSRSPPSSCVKLMLPMPWSSAGGAAARLSPLQPAAC